MSSDFCFATLALRKPYREMAKLLAQDLHTFAPGIPLVIATDDPQTFDGLPNVHTHPHRQTGLFRCLNDKRFALAAALEHHAATAVFVDADTRIHEALPASLELASPIATVYTPNLAEQAEKYLLPHDRQAVLEAARHFGLDPQNTKFVWDNLFAVSRDRGRERVFLNVWGTVTTLFDFQGVSITDGYCMSIAAGVAGWVPSEAGLQPFDHARHHEEASAVNPPGRLARLQRRMIDWWCWRCFRRGTLRALIPRVRE